MKRTKIIIISILTFIVMISYIFSYQRLPKGDYIEESTSPNGNYTVKTYLCNGGATVDWAVRGELTINYLFKMKRNIYWQYRTNESNITWKDNKTVIINGIEIELPNGKYDFRVDDNQINN